MILLGLDRGYGADLVLGCTVKLAVLGDTHT